MPSPPQRITRLQAAHLQRIQDVIGEITAGGGVVHALMQGESDLPTPPHIVEAGRRALAEGYTRYPPGRGFLDLRRQIAEKLLRENHVPVDPETEIFVTSGGGLGVTLAVLALVEPGDDVVLADPTYGPFIDAVTLAGARPVFVPRRLDAQGQLRWDADAVEAALTPRTRALLFDTPSAPTGTVLRGDELRALGNLACEHDLWLISDEVFESLYFDGHVPVSVAALDPAFAERTIGVYSFSKTYAMTGWRLGYVSGPAVAIAAIERASLAFGRPSAAAVQRAGIAALSGPQESVDAMRREYQARRAEVERLLGEMPGLRWVRPEGAFYVFIDFSAFGSDSLALSERVLREGRVALTPGTFYGPGGEGWLRLSFAGSMETVRAGLAALGELLAGWDR